MELVSSLLIIEHVNFVEKYFEREIYEKLDVDKKDFLLIYIVVDFFENKKVAKWLDLRGFFVIIKSDVF